MPELPEVERARVLSESLLGAGPIVFVSAESDEKVFERGPVALERALLGKSVKKVRRWGKYLWLEFGEPPHLLVHLGMSGAIRMPNVEDLRLASERYQPTEDLWPPLHTKLRLRTADGTQWAFVNRRRFGRCVLRDHPEQEPPLSKLGPDASHSLPSARELLRGIGKRRSPLKTILLDQSLIAGIGNWIADDVLLRARLSPKRQGSTLTLAEAKRLRNAIGFVIRTAIGKNAEGTAFPKGWLFHGRWIETPDERTANGEPIERIRIGGRTTLWVPSRQS